MKLIGNLLYMVRCGIGFVPLLSRFVFMDADAILRKLRNDGTVEYIQELLPSERKMLHFTFGMQIRNDFLLWHPKNPYTMLKLEGLSAERQGASPYHPDSYSWGIISRLIVAADITRNATLIDSYENLLYSLMARTDDDPTTLIGIEASVADLVANEQWDLIDDIFAETILYAPSQAKLNVLLAGVAENTDKLHPINYLRVAQRVIGYNGVVVSEAEDDNH